MDKLREFISNEFFSGSPEYKECSNCLMDTSDGSIVFDERGVCNYCLDFKKESQLIWHPSHEGKTQLDNIIDSIKNKNKNKKYDCILGISGGLDSSYLALKLKEYDLRVLAVHVDGGWNSELAVNNIEAVLEHCNFDLYTHVVNWESMKNVQLAFLKSGISNQDIPQDHVFFAVLHNLALKNNINIFMSGGNFATESILPGYWQADAMDSILIRDIFKKHGKGSLKGYKTISFFELKVLFRLRGFKQIRPLNYIEYGTRIAEKELEKIGWRNYERKHGESIFTKFFQNHFLVEKFGYDKRRAHLSSRILSGDITRGEGLDLLDRPLYDPKELAEDKEFISKKLDLTLSELDGFIKSENRVYLDYKNWDSYMSIGQKIRNLIP